MAHDSRFCEVRLLRIDPVKPLPFLLQPYLSFHPYLRCSNNSEYPLSWLDEESLYFFDSPIECCLSVFNYADCPIEDICERHSAEEPTAATTPMGVPSARNPTPAPMLGLHDENESSGRCRGKNGRKCFKTPGCQYIDDSCLEIDEISQPNDSSPGEVATDNPTRPPSSVCSGKNGRQCSKEPGCQFHSTRRVCVEITSDSQPKPNSAPEGVASTVPPNTLCAGKKSKKSCAKIDECHWDDIADACLQHGIPTSELEERSDSMGASTSSQQDCNGRKWHPKSVSNPTCSNSGNYPPVWDDNPDQYLFSSFEHCCRAFYGEDCNKEDVCDTVASR